MSPEKNAGAAERNDCACWHLTCPPLPRNHPEQIPKLRPYASDRIQCGGGRNHPERRCFTHMSPDKHMRPSWTPPHQSLVQRPPFKSTNGAVFLVATATSRSRAIPAPPPSPASTTLVGQPPNPGRRPKSRTRRGSNRAGELSNLPNMEGLASDT